MRKIARRKADRKQPHLTSQTNPKDLAATNRPDLTVVSPLATLEEAMAMYEGLLKYGRDNYVAAPVISMVYVGAMLRHLVKYTFVQDRDPETLVHELGSLRACAGILIEAAAAGTLIDNRPVRRPELAKMLVEFEQTIEYLRKKFEAYDPKQYNMDSDLPQGKNDPRKR